MYRHCNCIPHSSSEVHVILLIFPPAENGPFLLVEATGCAASATEGEQKTNKQKSSCRVPTLARSSDQLLIVMNGRDCNVSPQFGLLLVGSANSLAAEVTVSTLISCQAVAWERGYSHYRHETKCTQVN